MLGSINEFLNHVISGVAIGSIYALVALGFVLIYKATEVINFAQGELMMIGAFIAYSLITFAGLSYWLSFLITVIALGALGFLMDRVLLRPLVGQPAFSMVMVTLGFGIMARSIVSMIPGWGTDTYGFMTPFTNKLVKSGGLIVSWEHISIIVMTLILVLVFYMFFKYTKLGIAMQATSQNQLAAVYMGIGVKNVFSLTWAIAAGVAAFAGILLAPITFVHMNMGYIGLKAFPAAVLGGFTSIPGAIVGGIIIGVTESLAGVYLPIGWKDVAAYIILIAVLIIKPEGLFGEKQQKKV